MDSEKHWRDTWARDPNEQRCICSESPSEPDEDCPVHGCTCESQQYCDSTCPVHGLEADEDWHPVVMRTCCHRHGFESYRKKCPYCEIEAAFHLAIGSRDSLRDWVEIMRPRLHQDDSTLDQIVDNLDRIAEIVRQVEKDA